MSGLTRTLARRSSAMRIEEVPQDVLALARHALLDHLGVALAGSREALALALLDEMQEMGGVEQASVLGHGARLPALNAALVNGSAAHAHDYDDANMSFGGHTSAVLFPAVLALGERLGSSGADILTAYVAGYQAGASIGAMVMPSSLDRGFHLTGTVGVLAAAAASARLMGLDEETTLMAYGIAAAQAAGLRADGGTMCKPLHAGKAAQGGMLAALLARRGFTGRPDILECQTGFVRLYSDGTLEHAAEVLARDRFYLRENMFKFHASCFFTHSAVEAALALRGANALDAAQVRRITVTVHPKTFLACGYLTPSDGLQSKRSFPMSVAVVLAGWRTADLATFSEEAVWDPTVLGLCEATTVQVDDTLAQTEARVEIETQAGRVVATTHDAMLTQVPDLEKSLAEKFGLLAAPVVGAARAVQLRGMAAEITTLRGIGPLLALTRAEDREP